MAEEHDFRDLEINRLKANVDVVKNYYATLFGKNLAKIEDVVKNFDQYLEAVKEEDPKKVFTEELLTIGKKIKRAKTKPLKNALKRQAELLETIINMYETTYKETLKNWNALRQVM